MIVDIQELFNPMIEALGYPVVFENIKSTPTADHLMVFYLFAQPLDYTLKANKQPGFIQVSAYVKRGVGAVRLGNILKAVADAFPLGTKYTLNDVTARIYRKPFIGPALYEGDWYARPVSIPIEVIVK